MDEELKAKLASLEEAMAEKEMSLEICTARNEALEREAIDRKAQIDKYRRAIKDGANHQKARRTPSWCK